MCVLLGFRTRYKVEVLPYYILTHLSNLEATIGFEPTITPFAEVSLRPLGHVAIIKSIGPTYLQLFVVFYLVYDNQRIQ